MASAKCYLFISLIALYGCGEDVPERSDSARGGKAIEASGDSQVDEFGDSAVQNEQQNEASAEEKEDAADNDEKDDGSDNDEKDKDEDDVFSDDDEGSSGLAGAMSGLDPAMLTSLLGMFGSGGGSGSSILSSLSGGGQSGGMANILSMVTGGGGSGSPLAGILTKLDPSTIGSILNGGGSTEDQKNNLLEALQQQKD